MFDFYQTAEMQAALKQAAEARACREAVYGSDEDDSAEGEVFSYNDVE